MESEGLPQMGTGAARTTDAAKMVDDGDVRPRERRPRDGLGRVVDYLRVSVTDRCNLRCRYCLPEAGVGLKDHGDILTYEELERIIRVAVAMGVRRVRITGGEPLVRRGLVGFLARISQLPGLDDLSLTTNGVLLAGMAADLKAAGVGRLNISLDTLREDRFRDLTRGGRLGDVQRGLEAAIEAGFSPIKINTVLLRGTNDDEIADFADLTRRLPVHVRFIELMPLGEGHGWGADHFLAAAEARQRIRRTGEPATILRPAESAPAGAGPARYFQFAGAPGTVGFIAALSDHFCDRCNRIRLTADGKINPCLASPAQIDLRAALRAGAGDAELTRLLALAIQAKPAGHDMGQPAGEHLERRMSRIGG